MIITCPSLLLPGKYKVGDVGKDIPVLEIESVVGEPEKRGEWAWE